MAAIRQCAPNCKLGNEAVNRVWQWIFGQDLVTSPDNFGTTSSLPSNQALLDTLAVKFREGGWSVKKLVREIALSRAYQLSSTFDEINFAADPENALVWRMSKRRLDAESIRDAALAISGQLDLRPPLGSPVAERGNGPIGQFKQFPGAGVPEDVLVESGVRTNARSVYLPIAREMLPDALAVFDFAEPGFVTGSRETTSVPSQALYLLNSPFIHRRAEARRALDGAGFRRGDGRPARAARLVAPPAKRSARRPWTSSQTSPAELQQPTSAPSPPRPRLRQRRRGLPSAACCWRARTSAFSTNSCSLARREKRVSSVRDDRSGEQGVPKNRV